MPTRSRTPLLAASLLLGATAFQAQATLSPYTANGVELVYSSLGGVSWTKDANLFKTLAAADSALVDRIVALTPTYQDDHFGLVTLNTSADHFRPSAGWMSWWGAQAFVNYLNDQGYGGSRQWTLPTVAGNEMAELVFGELGGSPGNARPNTAFFDNEPEYTHWLQEQAAGAPQYAWNFGYYGGQQAEYKWQSYAAWVMTPGQVAAVPESTTGAMLLAGLGALGWLTRRARQRAD